MFHQFLRRHATHSKIGWCLKHSCVNSFVSGWKFLLLLLCWKSSAKSACELNYEHYYSVQPTEKKSRTLLHLWKSWEWKKKSNSMNTFPCRQKPKEKKVCHVLSQLCWVCADGRYVFGMQIGFDYTIMMSLRCKILASFCELVIFLI